MRVSSIYKALGPIDLKNVRRDSLLAWTVLLPVLIVLLIRFGVPALEETLQSRLEFDLAPYHPLIMSGFVMTAPGIVGMIAGFLLLDERDDRTLTALLVTPMPVSGYLFYRISAPMAAGVVVTAACYPIANLTPLPVADLIWVTLLGSLSGPITTLVLAVLAENKVSGFALVKLLNTVNTLPVAAYFLPEKWQPLAGIIPGFWPMKMLWLAAEGESYVVWAIAGLIVNLAVLGLLLWRFSRVLHR